MVAIALPLTFLYLVRWLDLYASGSFKVLLVCLGWAAAMSLPVAFNNVLSRLPDHYRVFAAVVVGLGGAGMVVAFILSGLVEERRWLKETLGADLGFSPVASPCTMCPGAASSL